MMRIVMSFVMCVVFAACALSPPDPSSSVAGQSLCSAEDQEAGLCTGPFDSASIVALSYGAIVDARDQQYPASYSNSDLLQCQKLGGGSVACQVDIAFGSGWGCLKCDFYYDTITGTETARYCHVEAGRCGLWR